MLSAESERVLARFGPQTKASASDYTGARRPPEHDAETSTTLKWADRTDGVVIGDCRRGQTFQPAAMTISGPICAVPGNISGCVTDCERMVAAMNFDNLVAVLAIAAAVPLVLAAVPLLRVPGPVLEIVAGIVLGPAVLDLVRPDQAVRLVATIGLAFLLFLAGLEIDVRHFRGPRARLAALALGLSALLVVRGLPAVLYRSALPSIRDVAATGLLQATSLPFIVAATTIGLQVHAIRPANAAALVAAGLFSVIIFPIISLQLLRSSAKGPAMVPEQAHVR